MGFYSQYMYVSIELYGVDDPQGLVERYGFRMSSDPDGRNGLLLISDQPALKNDPNTEYGQEGTFGYRDTDGDVGGAAQISGDGGATGLTVTKSNNPEEEHGLNGYDEVIISDGALHNDSETDALWVRIDPDSPNIVEFAFDYTLFGYTIDDLLGLQYLEFEAIKGDPTDPANGLWNDRYTDNEAGSPNPGLLGLSEFGTQGLGNIYELDTLRGELTTVIPEPGTMGLIAVGLGLGAVARKRRRRSTKV
jgi:hypothetical protein